MIVQRVNQIVDRLSEDRHLRKAVRRIPGLESRLDDAVSQFDKMIFSLGFLSLIRDPTNTSKLFEIVDSGPVKKQRYQPLIDELLAGVYDDAFQSHYEEKFLPMPADVDILADFAPGTFGRAFADHLRRNEIDIDFYPPVEVTDRFSYFELRARQVHDLWHVLTGFGIDIPGEVAVQAFTYAQWGSPFSALLMAGGLFHLTLEGRIGDVRISMDGLTKAYMAGRAAKPLLGIKLEELWEEPLADVRKHCGLPEGGVA